MPHVTVILDGDARMSQDPITGAVTFDVPGISFWHTDSESGGSAEAVERCLVEDSAQKHAGLEALLNRVEFKALDPNRRVAAILRAAMTHPSGRVWAALRKVREHPAGTPLDMGHFVRPEVVIP